jgi:hypothetical protein
MSSSIGFAKSRDCSCNARERPVLGDKRIDSIVTRVSKDLIDCHEYADECVARQVHGVHQFVILDLWGNIDAAQLLTVLGEPEVTAQRREGGVCRVRGELAIKQIIGGEGTALRSSLGREKLRLGRSFSSVRCESASVLQIPCRSWAVAGR